MGRKKGSGKGTKAPTRSPSAFQVAQKAATTAASNKKSGPGKKAPAPTDRRFHHPDFGFEYIFGDPLRCIHYVKYTEIPM